MLQCRCDLQVMAQYVSLQGDTGENAASDHIALVTFSTSPQQNLSSETTRSATERWSFKAGGL